jgi:outer membrane protein assembly factor BamB
LIHIGITHQLASAAYGWEGLTVTVTDPTGQYETLGPFKTDATGGTGTIYVPSMIGTYTFQTHFPEQLNPARVVLAGIETPAGTVMEASDSDQILLTVTNEQREYYPGIPLPTNYWTRPIDAQFREWSTIAGNWLTPYQEFGMVAAVAPYNDNAPESSHVLWAKPLQMGGLAGGVLGNHAYEDGDAYEGLFENSLIIGGVLFYPQFKSEGGTRVEHEVVAVDLHTGEELWSRPLIDGNGVQDRLSFGQVFYWDSYNYHAAFSYLWTTAGSTWDAHDPYSGRWLFSMENVPSGKNLYGPKGEIYRYTVDINDGWMTLWNSSRVISSEGSWIRGNFGRTFDATNGIEWNKTLPEGLSGSLSETFFAHRIFFEERMIGTSKTSTDINIWSVSLKPGQEGTLLFNTTWQLPVNNITLIFGQTISLEDGVFTIYSPEVRQHWGFSLDTGQQIWGPTEPQSYLDYLSGLAVRMAIYDGKLFSSSMSGTIYAYDLVTGDLEWSYDTVDPFTEILWSDNWPMKIAFFSDGKLYLSHGEHSPIDPKPRGAPFVCLNATNGEEIWRVDGAFRGNDWGGQPIIGDSIIATMNSYDQQIYAIGKGPTVTSIAALPKVISLGSSVMVEGSVNDVSPGTKNTALTLRFPNGVPVIADEHMGEWMKYVYQQFPVPENPIGVPVKIQIYDPNGNYAWIGTTTTDPEGNYAYSFMPQMEGTYAVLATFDGSKSYYGSTKMTYLKVDPAPAPYPTVNIPGYQGPSAQQVADAVMADLPDNPTPDEISNAVIAQFPEFPEPDPVVIPEYTTIDIVIIILVAIAIIIGIVSLLRKQK